jgi:hypothetical protein
MPSVSDRQLLQFNSPVALLVGVHDLGGVWSVIVLSFERKRPPEGAAWLGDGSISCSGTFQLSARRKAKNDGLFARSLWTPECNACCPGHCPQSRDKPCSTGFYAPRDRFVHTSPDAPCFQDVVKCLFRRRYLARGWDGVVLGAVHGLGAVAAAPAPDQRRGARSRGRPRSGLAGYDKARRISPPGFMIEFPTPAKDLAGSC